MNRFVPSPQKKGDEMEAKYERALGRITDLEISCGELLRDRPACSTRPMDREDNPHSCMDENATVVNGKWLCNCPGGPYYFGMRCRECGAESKGDALAMCNGNFHCHGVELWL